MDPDIDYVLKFIIIGDACVGKSSIMLRFTDRYFPNAYETTIGVGYGASNMTIDNKHCKIVIWDTAGQERYRAVTSSYYKDTCCAILVYDITELESFHSIGKWMVDVRNMSNNHVMVLVGNKSDLMHKRIVSYEEGQQFAKQHNMIFLETSAKSGNSIDQIFTEAAERVVKNIINVRTDINFTRSGVMIIDKNKRKVIKGIKTNNDSSNCC